MSFQKSKIQRTSEQRKYVREQQIEQIKQQKRKVVEAQQMESQNYTPQQLFKIVSTCDFGSNNHKNINIIACGSSTLNTIERLKLYTPQRLKVLSDSLIQLSQWKHSLVDTKFENKLDQFNQMLYQLGSSNFIYAMEYIWQKFEAKSQCAVLHKQVISGMSDPEKSLLQNPFILDKLLNHIFQGKQLKMSYKPHSIFAFIGLSRRQKALQLSLIQNEKIILSDIEQKGVIAYFVLQYITQFKPSEYLKKNESIRERLFKQVDLKEFILEKFNSVSQIQFHDVKDLGLKDINFVTVLSAFDLQEGFYYDSYVFNQERFRNSYPVTFDHKPIKKLESDFQQQKIKKNGHQRKTVLNPIIFMGQIIKNLKVRKNRIIYGDKGIGKSFTFLLYSYLSSYIIQARMQEQHQGLIKYDIYNKILKKGNFQDYPKLFYIPIKCINTIGQFSRYIKEQINGVHQKAKINKETLTNAKTFADFEDFNYYIKDEYHHKDIQILIVVDQANSYYGLARRYFFNKILPDDKENFIIKSTILKFISTQMFPYILNSSQMIENLVLSEFLRHENFYDYFSDNNYSEGNIKLQYSPFLNQSYGLLQLYHVFTFEISKHLSTNSECSKFKVFNNIIQEILQKCIKQDFITPWKIYVRPYIISQAILESVEIRKNLDELKSFIHQKIENQSQDFKKKQKKLMISIEEWFWKIKDQIQQFASLQIGASIVQFYKKYSSQSDKNYRTQLILQLRCAAFSMYNKPVQQFSIDTSELINLSISDKDYFLVLRKKQKMKVYLIELLRILPIFRYQQNLEQLNIHCKPRQFIDNTNFIISQIYKQQKIMNIYERIYSRKTSELTGFQFGFFLDQFAPRLFKKGYCRIQYIQHTSLLDANKMQFEIINGFQFESLTSTKDINKSFKHLLQHADKFPNQKFCCGAADKRNNQGFDFLLFRKKSKIADYEIYTFDFTTAKIQTKVNKRVSKTNQIAISQRKNMIDFFENANLSENELNQLLQQIEKAFQQIDDDDKINIKSLFKLVESLTQNNRKQNPLLDNILQLITPEGSSQNKTNNQQIGKRILKFITRLKKYITNKIYINKMLAVFGVLTNTKQVDIPRKLQDSYNTNSRTFQYNIQLVEARAIFIKLILECSLSTKQNLIQFINQIHKESYQYHIDFPQQIKKKSFFKKYSQRHHFFTPLKHLNNYSSINGKNGLIWKHVIAVPSYRVQQYQLSLIKKKNKADYLFEKVTLPSNGTKQLQFAIGQFEFNQNSIRIIPQTKHLDNEDHILLQKQYKFIQSLMKIMKNKKKQL